jgi:acetyl esterase/lipase
MPLTLDPEVAAGLQQLTGGNPLPPAPAIHDVKTRREQTVYRHILQNCAAWDDIEIKDFSTKATDGHEILLRWYKKKDSSPGSAVLYMHGGGMIFGEVEFHDKALSDLVHRSGVPFLSVEYRLCPEVQYPVPIEDCYAGLCWLNEHAAELGVDPNRIAVMGDSAGGLLAASLTLLARQRGTPKVAKQILIYPMLDDRNIEENKHMSPFLIWSHEDNITGWTAYLGDLRGKADVPETAAPAHMTDATGLPPTYIEVGELDLFRKEDVEFAQKISDAGVSVELHVRPGCFHCWEFVAPESFWSVRAFEDRVRIVKSV